MTTIAGLTITRSSFQEPDCYEHFSQSLRNTDLCRPSLMLMLMLMTNDTGWSHFGAYSVGGAALGHSKGWTVISINSDWKQIVASEK